MATEIQENHDPSPCDDARSRPLEGTFPEDAGCWTITAMRVLYGRGEVEFPAWPDRDRREPPEPAGTDRIAKKGCVKGYHRIRNSRECIESLNQGVLVQASLEITTHWDNPDRGVIARIPENVVPRDSRAISLREYLPEIDCFSFLDARSVEGWGLLPVSYFDQWLIDSWVAVDGEPASREPGKAGVALDTFAFPTVMGGTSVIATLHDSDSERNAKIGWSIRGPRDGFLDVEEMYVRPEYRGKGHGTRLALDLRASAEESRLPLRLWVPYADSDEENHPNLIRVATTLGLTIRKSQATWAGYVAVPGKPPSVLPSIRRPARPERAIDGIADRVAPAGSAMTADEEEQSWARKARRSRGRQAREDG